MLSVTLTVTVWVLASGIVPAMVAFSVTVYTKVLLRAPFRSLSSYSNSAKLKSAVVFPSVSATVTSLGSGSFTPSAAVIVTVSLSSLVNFLFSITFSPSMVIFPVAL